MSQVKIHWTRDEQELVIEAMAEAYAAHAELRFHEAWTVGNGILAPDRRRKWFSSYSGKAARDGGLFAEAKRRAAEAKKPKVEEVREAPVTWVPVPTPTPLDEVPLKELLAECIGRILALATTRMTPLELAFDERHQRSPEVNAALNKLMMPPKVETERPVRIAVCGLLPDQFRRVKEQINGRKVELVLVSNQYNPSKDDWKRGVDHAIVTRMVRHGHTEQATESLGRGRVHWVSLGQEAVVAKVGELVPGSVN